MTTLRLVLISTLVGSCAAPTRMQREPQAVGPELGESTAMGPADSSRPQAAFVPGGVPEDVGPGVRITGTGSPPPTNAPAVVVEEQPVLVLPVEDLTPPPVFTPPPPPPPPDLSDRVFSDDQG